MTSIKYLLAATLTAISLIAVSPARADTALGGLNLWGYCQSQGYSGVVLTSPQLSPDAVFNWYCFTGSYGNPTGFVSVDMLGACQWQYRRLDVHAAYLDRNDAYTWVCYAGYRVPGAPELHLPGDMTVNATSSAGALVGYTASASDDVDANPMLACSPASGSVFAIGTTTVTCTATDSQGNSTTGTFLVTVKGAAVQLADERSLVRSFGLSAGLENSFLVKLDHALATVQTGDTTTACADLGAFANEAQAQSGKALTDGQAAGMVTDAQRIRAVLGC